MSALFIYFAALRHCCRTAVAVLFDLGWHRKGFRLFWRYKSKPTGRLRLPKPLRELIREMATENPI
jgi:hypothetical protein